MNELLLLTITFFGTAICVFGIIYALQTLFFSESQRIEKRFDRINQSQASRQFSQEAINLLKKENRNRIFQNLPVFTSLPLLFLQAGMKCDPARWLITVGIVSVCAAGLAWVVTASLVKALGVLFLSAFLPYYYVIYRRKSRLRMFEAHLAQALDILSRSLRAGHPLPVGLQMISKELPDPLGPEFGLVFSEQQLGLPIEESLRGLAERVPLMDLRFFVLTVLIHRQTGGDLAEVLDNLSNVIRERFKVLGQVKALTAEGRLSGWVLSVLPVMVFFIVQFINPGYARLLLEHELGIKMLYTALFFQFLGILFIKKIVNIKV